MKRQQYRGITSGSSGTTQAIGPRQAARIPAIFRAVSLCHLLHRGVDDGSHGSSAKNGYALAQKAGMLFTVTLIWAVQE